MYFEAQRSLQPLGAVCRLCGGVELGSLNSELQALG